MSEHSQEELDQKALDFVASQRTWALTEQEVREAYWSVKPPFLEDEWQREYAVARAAGLKAMIFCWNHRGDNANHQGA